MTLLAAVFLAQLALTAMGEAPSTDINGTCQARSSFSVGGEACRGARDKAACLKRSDCSWTQPEPEPCRCTARLSFPSKDQICATMPKDLKCSDLYWCEWRCGNGSGAAKAQSAVLRGARRRRCQTNEDCASSNTFCDPDDGVCRPGTEAELAALEHPPHPCSHNGCRAAYPGGPAPMCCPGLACNAGHCVAAVAEPTLARRRCRTNEDCASSNTFCDSEDGICRPGADLGNGPTRPACGICVSRAPPSNPESKDICTDGFSRDEAACAAAQWCTWKVCPIPE